eukprot:9502994-Pyramimonas_sp.AAC.1
MTWPPRWRAESAGAPARRTLIFEHPPTASAQSCAREKHGADVLGGVEGRSRGGEAQLSAVVRVPKTAGRAPR